MVERVLKTRRDLVKPLVDLCLCKPTAFEHHSCAALGVRNVFQRVGFQQHQVGALAFFDCARF